MNAQLFYLKGQEELCRKIVPLLKRHIFGDEGIEIEQRMIADDYVTGESQEYLRLLKASMLSTHDFILLIEDSEGNWSYMGYRGYNDRGDAKLLRMLRNEITSLFPAVAVMDRMIMVPKGIHDALTAENFSWMLKPLEMGGLLLVDFQDLDSVSEGARQVANRLRVEIPKLCRRHMSMNKSASPNFEVLAELLRIESGYFERHREEILSSMVKLIPSIVSGPAKRGRPSRVVIDIRNESEKELAHVRVQVRAPTDAMRAPVAKILDFPASGGAQRIHFEISPKAAPYCPLEVLFEISETSRLFAPFSAPLVLDVTP